MDIAQTEGRVAEEDRELRVRSTSVDVAAKDERWVGYPPPNQPNPDLINFAGEDQDGVEDKLSPITIREQRVARARTTFGPHKDRIDRGDQVNQTAACDHRTTDVAKVLQFLHSADDSVARKALQRLHVKWYYCDIER